MKKQELVKVVRDIKYLCKENDFVGAGELARKNKQGFIEFIVKGGNNRLLYAYKVCDLFGMRQTDCFNLKF